MKPSELFCFKDAINFYLLWCKWISTRQLVEDVMSTGLTNTHMARGFCITCLLKNNAFSVLHYITNVALHYYMLHRSKISSAPGTIAHVSIRLPPRIFARLLVGNQLSCDTKEVSQREKTSIVHVTYRYIHCRWSNAENCSATPNLYHCS